MEIRHAKLTKKNFVQLLKHKPKRNKKQETKQDF